MKALKSIFLKDWQYKLMALVISVSVWSVVNFSNRTAITITRYVEIRNPDKSFTYEITPERVEITLYVVERLITSPLIKRIKAYVDVSPINRKGTYKIQVMVENKIPYFIKPASVDPPAVRVFVK